MAPERQGAKTEFPQKDALVKHHRQGIGVHLGVKKDKPGRP